MQTVGVLFDLLKKRAFFREPLPDAFSAAFAG
jgi:hypothetical protein